MLIVPLREDKEAWKARNTKIAEIWNSLSKDEQDVFRNPFFFALANLPDLSLEECIGVDNDDNNDNVDFEITNYLGNQDLDASAAAPKVHQLSEADKLRLQPLFDRLVNVEKLHLSHGKPDASQSVAKIQELSMVAIRKAHHEVSVFF